MVEDSAPQRSEASQLTCRALGHVLGVAPTQLRDDSPLPDIGADSVAVLVFADVVEAFAAQAGLPGFSIDTTRLRRATSVGDLAQSLTWQTNG
jgi:hypothetical protein